MASSAWYDPSIDQELLRSVEQAAGSFSPYKVEFRSGYRPGDPRFHGKGKAIDIRLRDPKTGKELDSYQGGGAISPYQQFANYWYGQLNPELQKKARWGGYFGNPNASTYGSKYGEQDYMHLDFGRGPGVDMLAGDWGTGFNQAAMSKLGLDQAGGIEALDASMKAAGYTPEQRRNAIAAIESAGSGDYKALGKLTGEDRDRAYGRYQVMGSNVGPWAEQYLKMADVTPERFLNDPKLQDQLFDAVFGDYVNRYGERGAASKWFTGSENEPAVTDVHGKLTGKTYADMYMEQLGRGPDGPAATEPATDDTTSPAEPAAPEKKKTPTWDETLEALGEGVSGLGGGDYKAAALPNQPAAAIAQAQLPPVDPQAGELRRQQLAMMMQRLNQGTLF